MDHRLPHPHQIRPSQSSAHGTGSIDSYQYHPPDQISNGSMNGFGSSGNGNPTLPPPPSLEQWRQMGMTMGMPPLPDLHSVINQLQSVHGTVSLPNLPMNPGISIQNQAVPLSMTQAPLPGLISLSPLGRNEHAQSRHAPGVHMAQHCTEVKIESPSSSVAQIPINSDLVNPPITTQSFSSQASQRLTPRPMARRDRSDRHLRDQAIKALKDLVEAGVRLDEVLSERELLEYSDVIRALYQEATGDESYPVPSSSRNRPQDSSAGEIRRPNIDHGQWNSASAGANPSPHVPGHPLSSWASSATVSPAAVGSEQSVALSGATIPTKPLSTASSKPLQNSTNSPTSNTLSKPPALSASTKPAQNREEYLAKLAAARKKTLNRASSIGKEESAPKAEINKANIINSDFKNSSVAKPMALKGVSKDNGIRMPVHTNASEFLNYSDTAETPSSRDEVPKKNPIKTDLVKQRLEELKRLTAAKQSLAMQEAEASKSSSRPSTPIPKPTMADSHEPSNGTSLSDNSSADGNITVTNFAAMTQPPMSQTPVMSLGAFGNLAAENGARKRPIAADFMQEQVPPKRMLIKKHFSPEPCVIDVSETDESEDDMDTDDVTTTPRATAQALDFRSTSSPQFASGLSGYSPRGTMSGVQTPDGKTANRLRDIEAQKRELEAKIAAMQQKKNRLVKGDTQLSTSPSLQRSISSPIPKSMLGVKTPSPSPNDQLRKQKMQMKSDLESQLAANMAKIEELRQQGLRLEENRNKVAAELEAAGVDTVGMTISEMRETQEKLHETQELDSFAEHEKSTLEAPIDLQTLHVATEVNSTSTANESALSATETTDTAQITPSDSVDFEDSEQQMMYSNELVNPVESVSLPNIEPGEVTDDIVHLESGEIFSTPASELDAYEPEIPQSISAVPNESLQSFQDTDMVDIANTVSNEHYGPHESLLDTNTPDSANVSENVHGVSNLDDQEEGEISDGEKSQEDSEDDDEMDMESSSNDHTDDEEGYEPELTIHLEPTPVSVVDDVPELRHYRQQEEKHFTITGPKNKFTPYESPLKQFKSYRYHPQYLQTVSQGYNSLTYSNKIDPLKPLCQFELAGGTCNDPDCQFQHFRDLGLNGGELLMQLGFNSVDLSKSGYQAGLKEHLNKAASQTGHNAESLASSIIDYRRQYVGDPSKVLDLEVIDTEL